MTFRSDIRYMTAAACAAFLTVCCSFSAAQATRTWSGAGVSNTWSEAASWSPVGAPVDGDTVVFADTGGDTGTGVVVTSRMDIPGLAVGAWLFENGTGNVHRIGLSSNTLSVTGNLRAGYNTFGKSVVASISGAGTLRAGQDGTSLQGLSVGYRNAAGNALAGRLDVAVGAVTGRVVNIDIGRAIGNDQSSAVGVLDLAGSERVDLAANRVFLGTIDGNNVSGGCAGTLLLPTGGVARLHAPTFYLGDANPAGNTTLSSLLEFGRRTELEVDTLAVGRRKSNASARFGAGVADGVLVLRGASGPAANLHVGYNAAGTGASTLGTFDARGGTLDATLNELELGRHDSDTATTHGSGKGEFYMSAGTVTVHTVIMAHSDAVGTSLNDADTTGRLEMDGGVVNVTGDVVNGHGVSMLYVDSGAMSVSNALDVDLLRVGYNGGTARLTARGEVRLGSGSGTLSIGRRDTDNVVTTGTADFSDAASVTVDADELQLGVITSGSTGPCTGDLTLSRTGSNAVRVATLRVGHSSAAGNDIRTSYVRFGGATNSVAANEIDIGQGKSRGAAILGAGGVLTIGGRDGGAADLYIGRNNMDGTGTHAEGTLSLTNGTVYASLDRLVIGEHASGNGSGVGTLLVGPGEITVNEVVLGHPSATGTSAYPLSTMGSLLVYDGSVDVFGDVRDGGGVSRIDVLGGKLDVRGALDVDSLTLGRSSGTNATFVLNGVSTGQTWRVGTLEQEVQGVLQVNVGPSMPVLIAGDAAFSNGSKLLLDVTDGGGPNTNVAEATVWTAGTGVWDNVTEADWSDGVPAAHVFVASNDVLRLVAATNVLTDNGLTCVSPGWTIDSHSGPSGTVAVVRMGEALGIGQRLAVIRATNAVVRRSGGLVMGDRSGSGADAAGLLMDGGALEVDGGMTGDGGRTVVMLNGGDVRVDGEFEADAFRLGYLGRTALLTVSNGAVRIGNPAAREAIDIARREGGQGGISTVGRADFSAADRVTLAAGELRVGSADGVNGPTFRGELTLSTAGTNELSADTIAIGDSPLEGNGAWPFALTNAIHLGSGENRIAADLLAVGRRKSVGRIDGHAGGTLDLRGRSNAGMTLWIGYNDAGTGTTGEGLLDASGKRLTAVLNGMVIGRHNNGTGAGRGMLRMDEGDVTVSNNVDLAVVNIGGTSANPADTRAVLQLDGGLFDVAGDIAGKGGTSLLAIDGADVTARQVREVSRIVLSGGTLTASAITNAGTVTALEISGGRLATDVIAVGTNVMQTGGVVAPAAQTGTLEVWSDYTCATGTLSFSAGPAGHSSANVHGALRLGAGAALHVDFTGPSDTDELVLVDYESLSGVFQTVSGLPAGGEVVYAYGPDRRQIAVIRRGSLLLLR